MNQIILSILLLLNVSVYAEESEWWEYYDRTKTIHLQFVDETEEGYTVNITWTPDGGLAPMLTGPALINFKSKNRDDLFTITADYLHVSSEVLSKAGLELFNDEGYNLTADLNKTYLIEYAPYQKISLWNNTHKLDKSGSIGQAPFFFEDVDLDGVDEIVVTNFRAGQRYHNEYSIYKNFSRWGESSYKTLRASPFDYIDQLTTFNKDTETITQFHSGGSCGSAEDVYKKTGNQFKHVQHTKWNLTNDMTIGNICVQSTFEIVDVGEVLKSESKSYYDYYENKWIEVCDENAAIQSESRLEFVMRNKACLAGGMLK